MLAPLSLVVLVTVFILDAVIVAAALYVVLIVLLLLAVCVVEAYKGIRRKMS